MKMQLDAAMKFLDTEMEWEYFRAEWLRDDKEKQNMSEENARKLRNFLVKHGYKR